MTVSETVSVENECRHSDLDINRRILRQGDGFIFRIDKISCKGCGAIMQFSTGKNKYSPRMSAPFTAGFPNGPKSDTVRSEGSKPFDEWIAEREAKGGGPGTESLRMYHLMGFGFCAACVKLADRMDDWGVAGCRETANFNYIVLDALPRAMDRWKQTKNEDGSPNLDKWRKAWQGSPLGLGQTAKVAAVVAQDEAAGVRMLIEALFRHAIDTAEKKYDDALAAEAMG